MASPQDDFGGQKPYTECEFCGNITDHRGHCGHCEHLYWHTAHSINWLPEPLTGEALTPRRWKDIQLIKKHGKAVGKTQHEINVEIFNYAYHVMNPTKPGPSPYLNICDIPLRMPADYGKVSFAPYYSSSHGPCPICGHGTEESGKCYGCTDKFGADVYHGRFPAPFTRRIFGSNHWVDIQLIRKRGQQLGKTEAEIERAISDYAKKAVAEMQASASFATTAAKSIFPIPSSTPKSTSTTTSKPTPTNQQPDPSPSHQSVVISIVKCIHAKIVDYFRCGQCYICKKRYWTYHAARACCAEEKKHTPPGAVQHSHATVQLSPYRFSDPCPFCKGSGKKNGFMCGMCDGRGSLRF